jgi:DNA-binding transcriptional LysR family regulator
MTGNEKLVSIPLTKYFPQRSYGLVLRRGRFMSPQARRFVEIMASVHSGKPDVVET